MLLDCLDETLPNGLRVLVHEQPAAVEVALALELPRGAAVDPQGSPGLAHLVEHVSYEGSAHAPAGAYDRWLAELGGKNQGWTGYDHATFTASVPPGALDRALWLESDRLGWTRVTPEGLANQRAVVAAERESRRRATLPGTALGAILWPEGHPYARSVVGSAAGLGGLSVEEVQGFAEALLDPRGAVLALVGPRPAGEMLAAARRWFGDVQGGASVEVAPVPEARGPGEGSRTWFAADVWPVLLRVGWRTVADGHADAWVLEIAASILERRLNDEGADVRSEGRRLGGTFVVAVDTERPARALVRVERAVADLRRDGPTQGEVTAAVGRAKLADLLALETPGGRAFALLSCTRTTGAPDCVDARWAALDALEGADVSAAVSRWLTVRGETVLAVSPWDRPHPIPRAVEGKPP